MPTEPLTKLYALFGADNIRRVHAEGRLSKKVSLPCSFCHGAHTFKIELDFLAGNIRRCRVNVLDLPLNLMACTTLPRECSACKLAQSIIHKKTLTSVVTSSALLLALEAIRESRGPQARDPGYGRWLDVAGDVLQRTHASPLRSSITQLGRKFFFRERRSDGSATLPLEWLAMERKEAAGAYLRRLLVQQQLVTPRWVLHKVQLAPMPLTRPRDAAIVLVWYRVPSSGIWISQRGTFALTWPRIRFKSPNKDNLNVCPRCASGPPLQDRTPRMEDRSARIHVFCNQCENMWVVSLTRRAR